MPTHSHASQDDALASVRQMIMAFRLSALIHAAVELRLPDLVAQGVNVPEEIAQRLNAPPRTVSRLLRTLVSVGLFDLRDDGSLDLNSRSQVLRGDVPGSLRNTALFYGNPRVAQAFALLPEVVRTGRSAFDLNHGRSFYDYIADDPALGPIFHNMMTDFTELELAAIVDAYDFSHARCVIDVGGGQGGLVTVLLKVYPALAGIVFDLEKPTEDTLAKIRHERVEARITFEAGDFFQGVPKGGDVYVLKSIIHNWQDDDAIRILRKINAAMPPNGRLLVAERVIPRGNTASEAKLFDINMMVSAGGLERTEAEHQQLLASAGLSLARVVPTRSYMSLIEASKQ
jgi:hypothetical protein